MPKTDHYHNVFQNLLVPIDSFYPAKRSTEHWGEHLITIRIQLIHHILKFCICWILSKRFHHCSKLFCGDCTISVFVIERKNPLDFFREENTCKEWSICSWDFFNSLKRQPFLNLNKHVETFCTKYQYGFLLTVNLSPTTFHVTQIERCRWNT